MKVYKSWIGVLGLFFGLVSISNAFQTINGTINGKEIWRSTDIANNASNVFIATGHVAVGYVFISSPGVNSNIFFQAAGSTNAGFAFPTFYGSSVPYNGATQGISTTKENYGDGMKYIMQRSTFGWTMSTTGDVPARLRILWDYIEAPRP